MSSGSRSAQRQDTLSSSVISFGDGYPRERAISWRCERPHLIFGAECSEAPAERGHAGQYYDAALPGNLTMKIQQAVIYAEIRDE